MKHLLTFLAASLFALQIVAQTISIQGVLRDPNGRSVDDGIYSVEFKIYDTDSGGTVLWSDTYPNLQTKHGVFQANLGENTSLDDLAFDKTYYVGVTVENYLEMTPRIALTTYPYAKAILGQDNKFPSTGNIVLAKDSIIVKLGALKFEGADGRIVFNDGTSLNTADFSGPASGLLNPSSININADKDTLSTGAINFQIAGSTKAAILNNGNASFGADISVMGEVSAGSEDVARGFLNLFGDNAANGGQFRIHNGANNDDTNDYWFLESFNGNLRLGAIGGNHDRLLFAEDGSASLSGNVAVHGNYFTVGQNDAVHGELSLQGAGTDSGNGGKINFFKPADHDGDGSGSASEYWFMEAVNDDFRIGNIFSNNNVMTFNQLNNVGIGAGAYDPQIDLAIGDHDTGINWDGDGKFYLMSNNSSSLTINDNGNVGIGATATAPTVAKLVVRGNAAHNVGAYKFVANYSTTIGSANSDGVYSIYADNRIATTEINLFSDARIKNIISISESEEDLETLQSIEITNYDYIDKIGKGKNLSKKVIAQQVEKVFPLAVSVMSDFIPSVFEMSNDVTFNSEDNSLRVSTDKIHDLKEGEIVRLIVEGGEIEEEVIKVVNNNSFIVKVDKSYNEVFVFGKKVDDFRIVDYDAISMLNVSATQELAKHAKDQEKRIAKLEAENAVLKKRLEKVDILEAKVNILLGVEEDDATLLGQK